MSAIREDGKYCLLFAIKSLNVKGGGAERVLVQVANELARRGHALNVMTFDGDGDSFYELSASVRRFNLNVGPPGQPTPRIALVRAMSRMRHVLQSVRPDLVIGFMHSIYVPLGCAGIGTGVKIVAGDHAGALHFKSRWAERLLLSLSDRLFVARTVPVPELKSEFENTLGLESTVLPNPVDLIAFRSSKKSTAQSGTNRIILSVGRLMEEKDHAVLIDAFHEVHQEFPGWTLRIVGEGELRRQLEAQIVRLHLERRVQLAGNSVAVANEYRRADIVAVPSRHEAFGLVTAEAMASGRPVIGFDDCKGTRSLINHAVNGWLVSGEDNRSRSFANGLRSLMTQESLRVSLGSAAPSAVAHMGIGPIADNWESFISEVVHRLGKEEATH